MIFLRLFLTFVSTDKIILKFDMQDVYTFFNDFPYIATASRMDLSDESADRTNRFPIIHAELKTRAVRDRKEVYVEFVELRSDKNTEADVELVRAELLKFICDEFTNRFTFAINKQFYTVSDMRGTILNSKYFLTPKIDS